jgi:hypothetical protein
MDAERCVVCGKIIPEGKQLCKACAATAELAQQKTDIVQSLRDVEAVLEITANTDRNIQKSMEAILRIADQLEVLN